MMWVRRVRKPVDEWTPRSELRDCCRCRALAVWHYAAVDSMPIYCRLFCQEHVPRNPSFLFEIDADAPDGHPDRDIMIAEEDAEGRILPSEEYDYHPHGIHLSDK